MHRIDGASAAASLPVPAAVVGTPGYFAHSDPVAGVMPTTVDSDWCNAIQEELIAVLVAAGIVPNKASRTQLRDAINVIAGNNGAGVTSVNGWTGAVLITLAALGGIPDSRQVSAGGLLTGGGDLSADRTLSLVKATSAMIKAGTDDASAITPAQLRGAITANYGTPGYRVAEDGWTEQWGIVPRPINEGSFIINFPIAFATECLGCHATTINSTQTVTGDTTAQEVSLSTSSATMFGQNHTGGSLTDAIGGFRWRAWGH